MRDSDFFFTKRSIDYATRISQEDLPRQIKFKKINWSIVCTSHDVCKVRGLRGHSIRQKIRSKLWKKIQHQNPSMKKTMFESLFGVWTVYKIKRFFKISK